ncbi:MAG TPA: TM0106 family RecB-like putative nuclease, partial [Candidatus Binatia bacterium]|nr:TM0106 family RecB-like putative nuclease [Candidatus Binatia bacterium]
MRVTTRLFEAYINCPTKCFLQALGGADGENAYANWVKTWNESYRHEGLKRLKEGVLPNECVISPSDAGRVKTAQWRLAVDLVACALDLESSIQAVMRRPSERPGQPSQFIPIRFLFTNKITRNDKLLLAFDALVLSEMLGRQVGLGKIIHGDNHATLKVKTVTLASEARKQAKKITALLSSLSPPDLVLNRHCPECEFQVRCQQKAMEKDDLSRLSGMTAKERKKWNSKGIFTVTQLSYTFRPRKKSKRPGLRTVKYYHSLKALALRENKIHVAGKPELNMSGTPVYLDVEGTPDRDFYYLIGLRMPSVGSIVQRSLWADDTAGEERIWREFLQVIVAIENPQLIHYGSYEIAFLRRMKRRYGDTTEDGALVGRLIEGARNALSVIYGHIYFPTYSNGLKDIAS